MSMPIFHAPGQGYVGDHGAYRWILDAAHDDALDRALSAYDAAVARRDALARTARPTKRADVEAAYRAERSGQPLSGVVERRWAGPMCWPPRLPKPSTPPALRPPITP